MRPLVRRPSDDPGASARWSSRGRWAALRARPSRCLRLARLRHRRRGRPAPDHAAGSVGPLGMAIRASSAATRRASRRRPRATRKDIARPSAPHKPPPPVNPRPRPPSGPTAAGPARRAARRSLRSPGLRSRPTSGRPPSSRPAVAIRAARSSVWTSIMSLPCPSASPACRPCACARPPRASPRVGRGGGYAIPSREFLEFWRTLGDEYGIMLICDEIQTGVFSLLDGFARVQNADLLIIRSDHADLWRRNLPVPPGTFFRTD